MRRARALDLAGRFDSSPETGRQPPALASASGFRLVRQPFDVPAFLCRFPCAMCADLFGKGSTGDGSTVRPRSVRRADLARHEPDGRATAPRPRSRGNRSTGDTVTGGNVSRFDLAALALLRDLSGKGSTVRHVSPSICAPCRSRPRPASGLSGNRSTVRRDLSGNGHGFNG